MLTLWRANLLGSSSKGHEYFLRHLLGVEDAAVRNVDAAPDERPNEVVWHEDAPTGKLDLFTTIDFRMNGSALYSDVVLPAATWYEKHDLSSTDLHPFVHSFNQAVPPPWEARTDFDIFGHIAERFSELAETHLGTRTDLVASPLLHDTPEELAQPFGEVRDWKRGECEPIPGKTMPKLVPVERDYAAVYRKWRSLGPLAEQLGSSAKGVALHPTVELDELRAANGEVDGRPSLARDVHMCEAILALSGVSNGRLAVEAFRWLEERTGTKLADIAEEHADVRITFGDTQVQPRKVIASPEWSGMESRDRRYSPFTINVERDVPFRTLTGRQPLYLEHAWMLEYGEGLPTYRPPLNVLGVVGEQLSGEEGRKELHVRWLSPHSKWSIHSEFQDNLHMLTLFRGGPVVWLSDVDAREIEVADNDWVEVFNRNGVVDRPGGRLAPGPVRRRAHVSLAGQARERPALRDHRDARRHGQLRHPHLDEADAPDRRIRAALVRLQLLRPVRHAARRDGRRAQAPRGGYATDAGPCPDRDGDEPRQVHRVPHLLGHLQERLDEPPRHGVRLVQRRRDEARGSATRSSGRTRTAGRAAGSSRAASCGSGQAVACASSRRSSSTPSCRRSTTTTSPGRTTTRR